jgi:hypothetical protein
MKPGGHRSRPSELLFPEIETKFRLRGQSRINLDSCRLSAIKKLSRAFGDVMLILVTSLLGACGTKKSPPSPPVITLPQLAIQEVTQSTSTNFTSHDIHAEAKWEIYVAQFPDNLIPRLGLDPLFKKPILPNAAMRDWITNHPFVKLARAETNIVLAITSTSYVGICSSATFSNAVQKFHRTAKVDFMTIPPVTSAGTNQARVVLQDSQNIALPSIDGSKIPRVVTLSFGQLFTLQAWSSSERKTGLQAAYWATEFTGYQFAAGAAKGPKYPNYNLFAIGGNGDLAPGETLLLGSGKLGTVKVTVQRTPYLSAIPILGQLFEKRIRETNYLRQVVMIRRIAE